MCGNIRWNELDLTILNHLHYQYLIKIYHISITKYIHFSLCIYSNQTCIFWIEYMSFQLKLWKIVKKYGRFPYCLIFSNYLKLDTKLSSCKVDHTYKVNSFRMKLHLAAIILICSILYCGFVTGKGSKTTKAPTKAPAKPTSKVVITPLC